MKIFLKFWFQKNQFLLKMRTEVDFSTFSQNTLILWLSHSYSFVLIIFHLLPWTRVCALQGGGGHTPDLVTNTLSISHQRQEQKLRKNRSPNHRAAQAKFCPSVCQTTRQDLGHREAHFSLGKTFKTPVSQITGQRTNHSLGYGALNGIKANSSF